MRGFWMFYGFFAGFLFFCFQGAPVAQEADTYESVTNERLHSPQDSDWLMYRRTYNGWGYSPLKQITSQNVGKLKLAWALSTGLRPGHESPPLVNGEFMFVTTPRNNVLALNAKTGEIRWRYIRQLPDGLTHGHPTNRGAALFGDRVYLATVDAHLVALAAETGEVLWDQVVEDPKRGYYITMAPLIVNGKVMVGVSGGERGIRGFVAAFDAMTGTEEWKAYSIPSPDEPGGNTWPGDTWRTGGAPVWLTGTFDPELNLTYWGTGNAGPWMGDQRVGDNLYTNSVIAVDPDTGELEGYHQYHWNGSWDWDEVAAPLLVDIQRDGQSTNALVHPGRNGFLWMLERSREQISFLDAVPFVYQDVFTDIDTETGRPTYDPDKRPGTGQRASFCPSLWGGKNWPPAAYNPVTRYLYIPANENLCSYIEGREVSYEVGERFIGASSQTFAKEGADHFGELQAWDLDKGEQVWGQKFSSPNWGPVLTTAGGLVFSGGTNDRMFRAFDAESGNLLWEQKTSSGIIGVPVSYMVNGVQYVAVQSGWGVDAQRMQGAIDRSRGETTHVPQGGVIWVFSLE